MNTLFGDDPGTDVRPSKCKGHADVPGHGPAGETCGTCRYRVTLEGGSRNFQKCELTRKYWTSGFGTDIRCKDPACRLWEPKPPLQCGDDERNGAAEHQL